jgi:glutaredoxin
MKHVQRNKHFLSAKPDTSHWLIGLFCTSCLIAIMGQVQAQTVYRIVDADGRITFSDKPPSSSAKVTPLEAGTKEADTGGAALPFELRQIVSKYPVSLFSSNDCAPCDAGRQLLRARGVPFTEKTVTTPEDSEALQRLSGGSSLPFLTVGAQQLKGFSDLEWTQYLSAAGYPEKNQLPARYVHAPPTPLVAVQAPAVAKDANTAIKLPSQPTLIAPALPPTSPANPTGIQF